MKYSRVAPIFVMLYLFSGHLSAEIEQGIIGGKETTINKWRPVAALVQAPIFNASLIDRQFCAGTLIDSRWVLTAAHCFFDEFGNRALEAHDVRVVLGVDDLSQAADELQISNIILHSDYVSTNPASPNDIALLELSNSVSQPRMKIYGEKAKAGTESVVVGWGALQYDPFSKGGFDYQGKLHEVTVPIVSNDVCESTDSYKGIIVSSQICAGLQEGGKDSCTGDSGGPLMIEHDGEYQQVGIVSFGDGCALADAYGVYTRLSAFDQWINDNLPATVGGGNSGDSDNDSDSDKGLGSAFYHLILLMLILILTRKLAANTDLRI